MDQKQIKVQPSAAVPLLVNFLRQLGILIGGGATMLVLARNFLGSRDVNEMIAWVSSQEFAIFLAALIFVLSSLSSFYRTVRNEWIKRTLTAEVNDDLARIQAHGFGKLLLAIIASLGLSACATIDGGTVAQRLFEARADYIVMKGVAVDYAEGPAADPAVVSALVRIRNATRPAVDYVDAYGACRGRSVGTAVLEGKPGAIDCATFNFTAGSISSATIALRSSVSQILAKLGRK